MGKKDISKRLQRKSNSFSRVACLRASYHSTQPWAHFLFASSGSCTVDTALCRHMVIICRHAKRKLVSSAPNTVGRDTLHLVYPPFILPPSFRMTATSVIKRLIIFFLNICSLPSSVRLNLGNVLWMNHNLLCRVSQWVRRGFCRNTQ